MRRVLTAVALVLVVIPAVIFATPPLFALLLVVVALLTTRELYGLAEATGVRPYRYLGLTAVAAVVLRLALPWDAITLGQWFSLEAILIASLLAAAVRAISQPERSGQALADVAVTLCGLFYPAMLIGLLGDIRQKGGWDWLLFLLLIVWLGDVAALYAGRAFGTHPLAPRLSPKKTWEGAVASVLTAVAVSWLLGFLLPLDLARGFVVRLGVLTGLAVATNIAAQAGDLVESLFKRGARIKDSGTLLPGHGGVLDRLDALLLAAPVVWYYLNFHF